MGAPKIAPVEAEAAEAKVDLGRRGALLGLGAAGIAGALGLKTRAANAQSPTPIAAGGCDAVPDAARRAQCRVDELEARARASGQRADALENEAACGAELQRRNANPAFVAKAREHIARNGIDVKRHGLCNLLRDLSAS